MGKRKRSRSKESDYDSILRKVRKLEAKLRRRRRSSSSVSAESEASYRRYYDTYEYDYDANLPGDDASNNIIDICEDPLPEPDTMEPVAGPSTAPVEPAPVAATPSASVLTAPPGPSTSTAEDVAPQVDDSMELNPEILQLLGADPADEKNCGKDLHKDIASRWAHILTNGLSKDTLSELLKCYLPPENCPNMRAPKLNLEIKAALLEINIKRDLLSQNKQTQLASSLAAIGLVLNWALSPESSIPQDMIKCLSDAGRLICDSHYRESQSRRYAALSTLNKNIKDTVKNTNIDEHLFGSDLSEQIKSSKAITKTGSEMKQKYLRPAYRAPVVTQPRGALNSRGAPPRVASAVEPRTAPAPRRPPRDRRRQEAPRGRRPANYTRQQERRRY